MHSRQLHPGLGRTVNLNKKISEPETAAVPKPGLKKIEVKDVEENAKPIQKARENIGPQRIIEPVKPVERLKQVEAPKPTEPQRAAEPEKPAGPPDPYKESIE